jgi:hypothetical protein
MLKKAAQQGRSKRRADAYPLRYVEGLSEARTMLADFFSILLIVPAGLPIYSIAKETAWKHGDAYSPTAS